MKERKHPGIRPARRKPARDSPGGKQKESPPGKIDYSRYRFSMKEKIRYGVTGALLGTGVVWLVYQRLAAMPLAFLCAVWYLRMTSKRLAEERRKTLQYHFRDFLSSLHTSMAAGYSLENGVRSAASDVKKLHGENDILAKELTGIVRQMEYQIPAEQLFREFGERSGVEDIRRFGELLIIAKRTGGNMDRILEGTWRNLCGKIDTAREIDALVAAKQYEQKLMSLMPAGVIVYLKIGFSGLMDKMYGNITGVLIMSACLGIYLAAFWLGRRLTQRLEV